MREYFHLYMLYNEKLILQYTYYNLHDILYISKEKYLKHIAHLGKHISQEKWQEYFRLCKLYNEKLILQYTYYNLRDILYISKE